MAIRINYTEAERRSFELQPETCPAVEAAIDEAFKPPSLDAPGVAGILKHYGFDPADEKLRQAIAEVMLCAAFPKKSRLESVILHRATFPLRAALVEQVKSFMTAIGERTDSRNHFQEWIDGWEDAEAVRVRQAKELLP